MPDTIDPSAQALADSQDKQIGIVNSVSGFSVGCLLVQSESRGSKSFAYRDASIGAIVKIPTERNSTVFGFVNSVELHVHHAASGESSYAVADIELFGEIIHSGGSGKGRFTRGVSIYPVLGAAAYVTTHQDMASIYTKPDTWHLEIGR